MKYFDVLIPRIWCKVLVCVGTCKSLSQSSSAGKGRGITPLTPLRHHCLILPLLMSPPSQALLPSGSPSNDILQMHRIFILRSHFSSMASSANYSLASTIKLNNGIQMPRIHLGVYLTSGRETSIAVTHALEAGYRGFDSAEWYANEKEVGSAITKYISSLSSEQTKLDRSDIWFTTKLKTNSGYDATRKAIKESIRKCGLGYLDLYLLHSPYGGKSRRLECWRAVEDAIEEGEVRAGGVSNFGVKHVLFCILENRSCADGSTETVTRTPRLETEDYPCRQPNRSPPF